MDERKYNDLLLTYRKGADFVITYISRGNKETSRNLWIDEITNSKGESKPQFRFTDSGNIFDPKLVGGFEKIMIDPLDD